MFILFLEMVFIVNMIKAKLKSENDDNSKSTFTSILDIVVKVYNQSLTT